jgi:hypothetical protein
MPQVYHNINFEIVSQRCNNDNILVEHALANIKTQTFVNFHSKNMVILADSWILLCLKL